MITLLLFCIFSSSFSFGFSNHNDFDSVNSLNKYTENGRVHNERVIEWPHSTNIDTISIVQGSIILFNCSVLANSNSSIEFDYSEDPALVNITEFGPDPINFTLAPGESYEETFTLVKGGYEFRSELSYRARLLTEGGNATVQWWYEILEYGKIPAPGFVYSFGILTLLSIIVIVLKKRKSS